MPDDTVTYENIDPSKKNSKRHFDEISEIFNVTCAYSDATDNLHDTLRENNLVIKSPHDEIIKMEMGTAEVSAVRIMTRIDKLMVESDREHDDVENDVKKLAEELDFRSVENLEKSESYYCEEDQMVSSVLQKQENPEVSYKESLLQVENNVSPPKISETGFGLVNGAQEKNAKATNHDNGPENSDSTSLRGKICLEQMPMMSDKLEKELGLAFEVPFGVTISVYGGDPFAEDNTGENNYSSIIDVIKNITSSIINKKENLLEFSHCSMQPEGPVVIGRPSKKLLILDINGLLADIVSPPPNGYKPDINIARRAIFKRPFYSEFLNFCLERFDVGIWSSRTKKNVERVTDYLLGDMKQKMLFCWDLSHCTATGMKTLENKHKDLVCKELRKIWEKDDDSNLPWERGVYNESNTLLLDDSPYKALLNPPHSAIFPHSYKFHSRSDVSLGSGGDIRRYLEELYAAENVQKFVEQHPFGQGAIDERNSSWDYYNRIISSPQLPLVWDTTVQPINEVNQNGEDLEVKHLPL